MTPERAPVQADRHRSKLIKLPGTVAGTVAWDEHLQAWRAYAAKYGSDQSAERIAERGGFGYAELGALLGREPKTWLPRKVRANRE